MQNHEPAIGHNGNQRTISPELSPHSNPHYHPDQRHPEPYNPFVNTEEAPSESSIYSPPPTFSVDKLDDGKIRFDNVDWIQKPAPTRSRNISDLDEVKLDGTPPNTNTNPPKPPFYRPSDSPPTHLNSPPYTAMATQDPNSTRGYRSPRDEKTIIATPPLTYYTPHKQENFRTNLDEKHGWGAAADRSDLQPFPDFEDVELARCSPEALPSPFDDPVPNPKDVRTQRSSRRSVICFWVVIALIFLAPLAIALGIFGGVYHWNIKDEQCSIWGGTWYEESRTCEYR